MTAYLRAEADRQREEAIKAAHNKAHEAKTAAERRRWLRVMRDLAAGKSPESRGK